MIVTTAQLYKVAYGQFAVGAYNINSMEQLLGLFRGNIQSKAPFIIKLTKCDSLAAAIGTSHGAYKFKGQQSLHFDVIEKIRENVKTADLPPTPIVMHGSSSVPKSEVERINAAGGKLDPSAHGVNEEEYLPAA